jgi:ADP-heptose:LPS heptosyltransferase
MGGKVVAQSPARFGGDRMALPQVTVASQLDRMQLKTIENSWRRAWIRILTRALTTSRARDGTTPSAMRRVLFLRPDRIGDMIVSTGVLRAIAESSPAIELDVLASPANAPVASRERYIHRVQVFDRSRPWRWLATIVRLRAARYDVVVDCMPTAPSVTTLLLMVAVGARERIGVAGRGNDDALTIAVAPREGARHIIDHLSALAAAFGVDVASREFAPALTLTRAEREQASSAWRAAVPHTGRTRRVLVNVSAGNAARHWPVERFVEVLRLVRRYFPEVQPLLVGGSTDRERTLAISRAAGVATAATPTLRHALALVATADVVLSADTGLAHAAAAFRRPVVVLHRRGSSVLWGLHGAPGAAVEADDGSLASLPVTAVWRALEAVIRLDGGVSSADRTRPTRRERAKAAIADARP